jgi:hypothetical protein
MPTNSKLSRGLPKRTGKASAKAKRTRHFARLGAKKDRRVARSSHGKHPNRGSLEKTRHRTGQTAPIPASNAGERTQR